VGHRYGQKHMTSLQLGDIILDPRRVVYIPSLKALVCSDLREALGVGIAGGLRSVMEKIDTLIAEYQPESMILLGSLEPLKPAHESLSGLLRRWGKKVKIHFVASRPDPEAAAMAEALGGEIHKELLWGKYRFVYADPGPGLELNSMTIVGRPNYSIRVGRGKFGDTFSGMRLAVFMKGIGRLVLPSLNPHAAFESVFTAGLERCDVFAVGHQRVLPMGKVADLRPFKGIVKGVPIVKTTLSARRRTPKAPKKDVE